MSPDSLLLLQSGRGIMNQVTLLKLASRKARVKHSSSILSVATIPHFRISTSLAQLFMNSATPSLSVSITSALALKPSTIYILRIDNIRTRQRWHIRRCFSEFCELREKLLSLIDDQMAEYLTSLELEKPEDSALTQSSNITSSTSTTSSVNSYRESPRQYSAPPPADRFAYVFKQFPPRKLFRSRSKRVIETRSLALNCFLQQTLEIVEVVRQRQLITISYSMMSHIETFLDCKAHSVNNRDQTKRKSKAVSPISAKRSPAAMFRTPSFNHSPFVSTPAITMPQPDLQCLLNTSRYNLKSRDQDNDIKDGGQQFNNLDFTQRFYREFGRQDERAEIYGVDLDEDEAQVLTKARSAMLERETHERKLYHTGSHFPMLESAHVSAEMWERRMEIPSHRNALYRKPESKTSILLRKISEPATNRRLHRRQSNYRRRVQH
ncbi:hypothetical protein CCR75_004687 [Bremia lactucae]|uniref:PX domain-containing protein n=1 Tax=Bremia lactucae TaxID=4779 RepID=A0A976IIR5_BRELC|nr:hypothetical protein CCR75_004687 [Bremia lactucae]